jgi:hypothetical protein
VSSAEREPRLTHSAFRPRSGRFSPRASIGSPRTRAACSRMPPSSASVFWSRSCAGRRRAPTRPRSFRDGRAPRSRRLSRDRSDDSTGASRPFEAPRFDQSLHRFLDEQRISPGPVAEELVELPAARVASQQVVEQLRDRLRSERQKRQLLIARFSIQGAWNSGRKFKRSIAIRTGWSK